MNRRSFHTVFATITLCFAAQRAAGFPYVVTEGDTLASIAKEMYGDASMERVLVAANALDHAAIRPGLRLEIPALQHHRALAGDTWESLAAELLGSKHRADVFAAANDKHVWQPPGEGTELIVPYNLRVTVSATDSLLSIALKFTGRRENAWVIDQYNKLGGAPLRKGDIVLVPLVDIALTPTGREKALLALTAERTEAKTSAREAQKRADTELPTLLGEVRMGLYVDAVVRAEKLLLLTEMSKDQRVRVLKAVVEAYVALEAKGHARERCREWKTLVPDLLLDPVYVSPKIIAACDGQ